MKLKVLWQKITEIPSPLICLIFLGVGIIIGALVGRFSIGGADQPHWLDVATALSGVLAWSLTTFIAVIGGLFAAAKFIEESRQRRMQFVNEQRHAVLRETISLIASAKRDASNTATEWTAAYFPKLTEMSVRLAFVGDKTLLANVETLLSEVSLLRTSKGGMVAANVSDAAIHAMNAVVVAARDLEHSMWGDSKLDEQAKAMILRIVDRASDLTRALDGATTESGTATTKPS